jgi:hypothetical protein
MVVVQQVSARVGRTTGHGLAGNLRRHCPGWFLYVSVALLLVANVVAIAADLSVMADALRLLVGGPHLLYVLLFGAFCVGTQIFMRYTRYVAVLKWTTLSLFAYFGALFMAEVPWEKVAAAMLAPSFTFETRYVTTMVAIFGVALSPYLFFWQASQEVEDQRVKPLREPLVEAPEQASGALERIRLDTYRHGGRQPGRPRDRHHRGNDASRQRSDGGPDLRPGGRSAPPDRRRLRLRHLFDWHHRHRAARHPGAGWLRQPTRSARPENGPWASPAVPSKRRHSTPP